MASSTLSESVESLLREQAEDWYCGLHVFCEMTEAPGTWVAVFVCGGMYVLWRFSETDRQYMHRMAVPPILIEHLVEMKQDLFRWAEMVGWKEPGGAWHHGGFKRG